MFLAATVLIIYYKQLSEAHEDVLRFRILEDVGMDSRSVRQAIRSQVRMTFFSPLVVALIHACAASGMMLGVVKRFGVVDQGIFDSSFLLVALIFAAVYLVVFAATSHAYFRVVKR
jgi:putative ABC transport system permease protein